MESKIIRGWIVRILSRSYPLGIEASMLQKQLNMLSYPVTHLELTKECAYLKEKGFMLERHIKELGMDEHVYMLTAGGVDLAEGTIVEEGVSI